MRAMKKHSRSGFTLMELIIVIALFSIIMYSIVALMDPVSKYFVRSSNFESTTACMDNIKRGIEGNLKYADRVRVYKDFAPYVYNTVDGNGAKISDYKPTTDLKKNVQNFYNYFFENRKYLSSHGSIYVLVFDNTEIVPDAILRNSSLGLLSDYSGNAYNTGKMVLYEYKFNNYDSEPLDIENPATQTWYINQHLYGNYDYKFKLGAFDVPGTDSSTTDPGSGSTPPVTPPAAGSEESPATFDPQDCTIGIQIREIMKDSNTVSGLSRSAETENASSTFSMKNVLDATQHYNKPLADYILIENPNPTPIPDDDPNAATKRMAQKYVTLKNDHDLPVKRYRYAALNTNLDAATIDTDKFDGFYFIFTIPEKIYDDTDKDEDYTKFIHDGHVVLPGQSVSP